jgi:hypothetical protein
VRSVSAKATARRNNPATLQGLRDAAARPERRIAVSAAPVGFEPFSPRNNGKVSQRVSIKGNHPRHRLDRTSILL